MTATIGARSVGMRFTSYSFGSVEIDGVEYEHDVIVDRGQIRRRKKGPSKPLRAEYGHTPLSTREDLPWRCRRLVIGTGAAGSLPVEPGVVEEAERRGVVLLLLPTAQAIDLLNANAAHTNAVLHLTC
jgi:hypothetical protein